MLYENASVKSSNDLISVSLNFMPDILRYAVGVLLVY